MCTGADEQMVPDAAATSQVAASFHSTDVQLFHAHLAHLGMNIVAFSNFGGLMAQLAHSLSSV